VGRRVRGRVGGSVGGTGRETECANHQRLENRPEDHRDRHDIRHEDVRVFCQVGVEPTSPPCLDCVCAIWQQTLTQIDLKSSTCSISTAETHRSSASWCSSGICSKFCVRTDCKRPPVSELLLSCPEKGLCQNVNGMGQGILNLRKRVQICFLHCSWKTLAPALLRLPLFTTERELLYPLHVLSINLLPLLLPIQLEWAATS